ncbi:MAG: response regulator [Rhodospirillales bacterium]|jgi:two-component system, chemotaxis family, chemotaxis protein CheY|nr:response regulator [Rhodospirillales bacterium]
MNEISVFSSLNVLVVEDEAFSLRFVLRILQKIGVSNVLDAANGAEALERLANADTRIDLVFSDIEMPEMDGYELVRRIRDGAVPEYKDVPVLMLTGQNIDDAEETARIHKIDGYIVKPPKPDQLEVHMRRTLGL